MSLFSKGHWHTKCCRFYTQSSQASPCFQRTSGLTLLVLSSHMHTYTHKHTLCRYENFRSYIKEFTVGSMSCVYRAAVYASVGACLKCRYAGPTPNPLRICILAQASYNSHSQVRVVLVYRATWQRFCLKQIVISYWQEQLQSFQPVVDFANVQEFNWKSDSESDLGPWDLLSCTKATQGLSKRYLVMLDSFVMHESSILHH